MNGILGYLRLDGAPLAAAKLNLMQAAMAYWGTDGSAGWSRGSVGLGCQFCFCTPEETEGALPYYDEERGLVLTAGAFLDNRQELCQELGLSGPEGRLLPDSLLIHRAYRQWGEDCVHHLLGDWHFALWDVKARRLFLARDHCGNTGVCYVRGPGFLAFASSRKALLALPEVPQAPHLLHLAQILTSWPGDWVQTAYAGIYRLAPAHFLRVVNGEVEVRQYWSAAEAPQMHLPRETDYLEAFLEQYERAVRARLRANTPISATLSGGLDSGSVCALAARNLEAKGRRLAAYTAIPLEDTTPYLPRHRCGDESALAQATAGQAGNIDLTLMTAAEITPLAGITRMLAIHDEPGHAAANQFWLMALLARVRGQDSRVLLTGQGGNLTVSWNGGPVNLWHCLISEGLGEFRWQFQELVRRHRLSVLGGVKRFLVGPLVSPWRQHLQYGVMGSRSRLLSCSAIHLDYARSLDLESQMRAQGQYAALSSGWDSLGIRQRRIATVQSARSALWGEKSGAFGLEVRDPTLDKRLWQFCLGIPEIYHIAEGRPRAVLRQACRGLLPEVVRLNQCRGQQAADICRRVRDQAGAVGEALRRLERHTLARTMLDLPRMTQVLHSMQRGATQENTVATVTILLRGLGVGLFLERF